MNFLYRENTLVSVYRDNIKGFCVIADSDIERNRFICTCPVGFMGLKDLSDKSEFNHYPMWWNDETDCIAFGVINLLNHNKESTVFLERDFDNRLIHMYAAKDIKKGEELVIDYDCELWFEVK